MAKRLNYQVSFTADTSQLSASVKEAVSALQSLNSNNLLNLREGIQEASLSAQELAQSLQAAYQSDTGTLNLTTFNDSLERSGATLTDYYNQLILFGEDGRAAFLNVADAIMQSETPLYRSNQLMSELWVTMKNTARWQLTSSALHGFIGSLETAYGYTQDLNESLTNIRIVTGASSEEMANFAEQANEAAKALSTTTTDYTDAALIYYQQGLSNEEVLDRTETTVKLANVAGESAEIVSDQLTAIWNNFYDGSQSLEYYADVLVRLGADTASSSDEIAEGMEKFAGVANTIGLSYEYAAAALTTITATSRESADTVGTSLRTIFSRLQGLSLGETLDDGTTLNKYSTALDKVGVSIFDTNGELKDMDTILDELGNRWGELSKDVQVATAQTVAGVRQYNQLVTLMDNWDFFEENLSTAYGAEGSLDEQAEIYAESWEGARDRVTAAAEDIYDSVINEDFFIGLDNAITPVLSGIADAVDAMGGMNGVLAVAATLINKVYGDKIAQSISDMARNLGLASASEAERATALKEEAAFLSQQLLDSASGGDTTTYEYQKVQNQGKLIELQAEASTQLSGLSERQTQLLNQDIQRIKNIQAQNEQIEQQAKKYQQIVDDATEMLSVSLIDDDGGNISSIGLQKVINAELEGINTTSVETAFSSLMTKIEETAQKSQQLTIVQQQLTNNNGQVTDSMINLVKQFELFDGAADASDEEITQFILNIEKLGSIGTTNDELRSLKSLLLGLTDGSAEAKTSIDAFIAGIRQGVSAEEALNRGNARMAEGIDDVSARLKSGAYNAQNWAERIVSIGSAASQATMAINAFKSLGNVFSDEDMTDGERLVTIMTSLSMLAGPVSSGFKVAASVMTKMTSATAAETGATVANTVATNANTTATVALAAAKKALQSPTLLVAATIAAVTAVVWLCVKAYNSEADAAKRLADASEEVADANQEVEESYDNLKSAFDAYESAVEALEECTKGTQEWNEALTETTTSTMELLDVLSQIQGVDLSSLYTREDGQIVFDSDKIAELMEQLSQASTASDFATGAISSQADKADAGVDLLSVVRDSSNSDETLFNAKEIRDALVENIDELAGLGSEELKGALSDFDWADQITDYDALSEALEEYAATVNTANSAMKAYADVLVSDTLGTDYGDDVQEGVSNAYLADYDRIYQEQLDTLTGSGISRAATGENSIYQDMVKDLVAAGYNYATVDGQKAVMGTDNNRSFTVMDKDAGDTTTLTAEAVASMLAASQAMQNVTGNADELTAALNKLSDSEGEGFRDYLSNGNFEELTKGEFDSIVASLTDGLGDVTAITEDDITNYLKELTGLTEDQLKEFYGDNYASEMKASLEDYATALEDYKSGMLHATQDVFDDLGAEDLVSVDAGKYILDAIQDAVISGSEEDLDVIQDLFSDIIEEDPDNLEDFVQGIQGVSDWSEISTSDLRDLIGETELTDAELQAFIDTMANVGDVTATTLSELQESYASVHEVIDGLEDGATLTADEYGAIYDYLGDEASNYFDLLLGGSYKLKGSAEDFYDYVQQSLINDYQDQINSNNEQIAAYTNADYSKLENVDSIQNILNNALNTINTEDWGSFISDSIVDSVEGALNTIEELEGAGEDTIAKWREQLEEGTMTKETLQEISGALDDVASSAMTSTEAMALVSELEAENLQIYIGIANTASSLDELRQMLDAGTISVEAFNAVYGSLWESERTENLDSDELADYTDYLYELKEAEIEAAVAASEMTEEMATKALEEYEDVVEDVAIEIMNMNDAIEDLADNIEDWADVIKKSSKESQEYGEAVTGIREDLSKLLDVESSFISADYIANNLSDIEKAAEGDAAAIDRLRAALLNDIILDIQVQNGLSDDWLNSFLANENELWNSVSNMQSYLDGLDWSIDPYLDMSDFNEGEANFIDMCNELIDSAGLTQDQVTALFGQMGYDVEFEQETVPQTTEVPVYETVHEVVQGKPKTMIANIVNANGQTENHSYSIPTWTERTYTTQVGTKEAQGEVTEMASEVTSGDYSSGGSISGSTVSHISGISKKASSSSNNYSSSNSGGSPGGSGSSGSPGGSGGSGSGSSDEGQEYETEETLVLEDILDRYHEINRALQDQQSLVEDLSNISDRLFGIDKLKAYDDELASLADEYDLYLSKMGEAQEYLVKDQAELAELFGNTITFDADNLEILDYDSVLQYIVDEYNAVVDGYNAFIETYNTLTGTQQEARVKEYENWQDQLEAAEELKQERLDALSQYEDTLDTIQDVQDALEDLEREMADMRLTKIEYQLDLTLSVHDMQDSLRELGIEIAESFGDALTHTLSVAPIQYENAMADMSLLDDYETQYKQLLEELENATDATDIERITEDLESLQGEIIDTAEELLDFIKYLEETLPEALDAASDRLEEFLDQLDHNDSILETIQELYELQGVSYKTTEGFSAIQAVAQQQLESYVAQAQLQQAWYENAKTALEQAEAELAAVTEDDEAYDTLKANRDALLEEMNEAQEAMLEAAAEAMEAAQEMYENAIEKAVYDFGQIVSNGTGLDLLSDQYDHYIEQSERYLDTVNEAYEVASWYSKLQTDIDNTTNSALKEKLIALQEEIDTRRENNTLSEYDLKILEAKYAVLQAEIALEDAQNAKNDLRLVRDSQGNWNYQYTADADAIASAQQDLLDAENKWYNTAKQQVEDVTEEIISTWQECQDALNEIYSDMTLSDEERAARAEEIYSYYTEKIKYLENEKQIALEDMTEAGNESLFDIAVLYGDQMTDLTGLTSADIQAIVEETGMSVIDLLTADNETIAELFEDNTKIVDLFTNSYGEDLDEMTSGTENFEEYLANAMAEMQAAWEEYANTLSEVATSTGSDLDSLAEYLDEVTESTDSVRESGLEAIDVMWEQLEAVQELSVAYADLASSVYEYIYALQELAGNVTDTYYDESGLIINTDWSNVMAQIAANGVGYDAEGNAYYHIDAAAAKRDAKIAITGDNYGIDTATLQDILNNFANLSEAAQQAIKDIANGSLAWLDYLDSYDTGGYTGDYESARLAMLHPKELVLNADDTENILSAVAGVRTLDNSVFEVIERALDSSANASIAVLADALKTDTVVESSHETIDQYITISSVEFPGVTTAEEINEAFATIVNDAAQWASRRTS